MITVQPVTTGWRRALVLMAMVGAAVATLSLYRAVVTYPRTGAVIGNLVFGVAALLAVRGDLRVLRLGALTGSRRLTRHLWRMCMALWFATASFFLGPRRRVEMILPDAIVVTPVIVIPVITVLLMMGYWIWRLRSRAPLRGVILSEPSKS
jgi:hypothetical protein